MNRFILNVGIVFAFLALAACGGKDKEDVAEPLSVEVDDLGPNTKDLVKDLPKGLIGDKENARYTTDNLRGEDEEDG